VIRRQEMADTNRVPMVNVDTWFGIAFSVLQMVKGVIHSDARPWTSAREVDTASLCFTEASTSQVSEITMRRKGRFILNTWYTTFGKGSSKISKMRY